MQNPPELSHSRTIKTIETSFFFLSLPFFIMGLLLPVYGKELGATALEIGLIFSAFSVMTILMRPLVGWALDRLGRRPFYVSGMLGYALTMVAFAYSDQVWGMFVARLLQGIASACAWLSASAILADLTGPENRARYSCRTRGCCQNLKHNVCLIVMQLNILLENKHISPLHVGEGDISYPRQAIVTKKRCQLLPFP